MISTEHIRTAVLCTCCAAMGLSLAEGILPFERFEKQLRTIFSLLLLTALLHPLTGIRIPDLSRCQAGSAAYSEEIAEQAALAREAAAAESIRNALNRTLAEQKAPCTVTDVYLHIQDGGRIDINEVVISGNLLTAGVYLRDLLGKDITVTKGGDGFAGMDRSSPETHSE